MRVTCLAAHELDDRLIRRWDELQSHPDHPEWLHPFLSAAFFQLTGQIRSRSRVAVLEDAGRMVGLWAFELPMPGVALPLARHMSDLQGVLLDPQWVRDQRSPTTDDRQGGDALIGDIKACPLRWMARQGRLPFVRFDHLLQFDCPSQSRIRWMVQLNEGFESYRREQMSRSRWWRRASGKARKLAEAMGPLTWHDEIRDDAAWQALARWKSAQYRASGLRDNFSIGWVRDWLERLRWADGPSLKGSLQSLRAGGQIVAVHFGVRGHHLLHHYLPAYDHQLSMHSPGSVLLEQTIAQAPGQGVTLIDLSTGDMDYKQAVSNRQEAVGIGMLGPSSLLQMEAWARQAAARLRHCPGLLPVARRGRRAWVRLINGPG
jgi:CelD/BcsL family acetyltransferase involved in cellulose biosynthesis